MTTKPKKRKLADWSELFDTGEMDHVCDAVRVNIVNVTVGEPSDMNLPLRKWLLVRLESYVEAHWVAGQSQVHVLAAERFRVAVERLADLFEARYPFIEPAGRIEADALRLAWLEFIAYGGAHWMLDRPRRVARSTQAAGNKRGRAKKLTAELLAQRVKAARRKALTEDMADALGVEFKIGRSTVYRRQGEARKLKLLPEPRPVKRVS